MKPHYTMNNGNLGSKNPLRRKSPVTKRQRKEKSLPADHIEEALIEGKLKRANSLTIESNADNTTTTDGDVPKKVQLKITHSNSFTFENIEFYTKSQDRTKRKDYLEVPEEENEDFYDALDVASLNINYDLPTDPIARSRWINGIRNHASGGKLK